MTESGCSGLPVIPLSPIVQSYILSSSAHAQATEKLNEAKQISPPVSVDVLRRLIENLRVERHRLESLSRKMQSVEAATPLFWDAEVLARQIAIVNSQLFSVVVLDKQAFLQLDQKQTGLSHLIDFHHYLSHNMAHQLIYWVELTKSDNTTAVVPPAHSKDSLAAHLIRVAHLLLHAYRDFSGFAAIMNAFELPEVHRLQGVWQSCSSHIKEMYKELSQIVSPANNYQAYRHFLYNKLELHIDSPGEISQLRMIAIPWIHPHLFSIQSIVTVYTANDNEDLSQTYLGDVILSTPGAHKMDTEMSILELCQGNSGVRDDSLLEHIPSLDKNKSQRASIKAIYLDGLRTAVMPVTSLNSLAPGDSLTHHWLVSRVYLCRDQLIDESKQVEPLRPGEEMINIAPVARPVPLSDENKKAPSEVIQSNAHETIKAYHEKKHVKDQACKYNNSHQVKTEISTGSSKPKMILSPVAPKFVPKKRSSTSYKECSLSDDDSEIWRGYPGPSTEEDDDDEEEIWKGYPGPNSSSTLDSPRRASSQSETSEEWKGYHATKMEADWQRESEMKVKQCEWQGYTLETYNEDELDSSTMMDS